MLLVSLFGFPVDALGHLRRSVRVFLIRLSTYRRDIGVDRGLFDTFSTSYSVLFASTSGGLLTLVRGLTADNIRRFYGFVRLFGVEKLASSILPVCCDAR